ncbi:MULTISPECIES: glycosyltransferase family 2 protein [Flavobacteriaceae]|uniref:Glycosyltransferase family 2 protein n=2 Tax=Flavobacteriaceae TaxID=49546 RepID=A0A4Y8ANW3_9FLAO|nr:MULTISPECIES: glycosyltransferase family 2 protein [Flavobacteriaceae]TEW72147.1 glycosyltransferase family 2 protein [Gramella jeungdoensis]GGK56755.1 glycosyl transferase family 2 [Lutibacter litoralis]
MDVSVVIVNYNVRYFLEQCILSVKAASKKITTEIIVVDNNSNDESCKILLEKYPEVILLKNKENVGFSKANNQGVKAATGDYVLILNPDTIIAEDTLDKIFAYAKIKQNLGVLGVKLIDGAGKFAPESKRGIPTPNASFNKLFGISSKRTGKYYATYLDENESGIIKVASGAFMFIKRTVFNEVKGFNEDYFMYGEDIDLSMKLLNKGYQNYYYADTQIIHFKGESTPKDIKYLNYFHRAMRIFYKKHFKLNFVYDFFMRIGIEFWYLFKYFKFRKNKTSSKPVFNLLYLGNDELIVKFLNKKHLLIKESLIDDYSKIRELIKNNRIDTIIFDNSTLSNKKIIAHFEVLKNEKTAFKIHPRTTNFIIGSTSPNIRGQVEIIE